MPGPKAGPLRRAIYDYVLKNRYVAMAHLHKALPQYQKNSIAVTVYLMTGAPGELIVAGTIKHALEKGLPGFAGLYHSSYVYAVAGTALLSPGDMRRKCAAVADGPKKPSRKKSLLSSSAGSGVIAPPPYRRGSRWGDSL